MHYPFDHPFVQLSLAVFALAYAFVALILVVMASLMQWVSKRPGTKAFGLRLKSTLANDEVWKLAHLRMRIPFLTGAVISLLFAVCLYIFPILVLGHYAYIHGVLVVVLAAILFVWIRKVVRKTAMEVNPE